MYIQMWHVNIFKNLVFKLQVNKKNLQGRSHLGHLELLAEKKSWKLIDNFQKLHENWLIISTHFCIKNAFSERGGKQTQAQLIN